MPIFDSEEEQDHNSSPASRLNHHPSRATSNKHHASVLIRDIEAQLLQDIENSGGIHSASLYRICNLKPELYGVSGSKDRKRIQNLVNRWKQLKNKEYKNLLCNLLPDKYTSQEATTPTTPLPREDEEEESYHEPPTTASRSRIQLESPLSTAIMLSTSSITSSASKNVTYIQRIMGASEYGEYILLQPCLASLLSLKNPPSTNSLQL